MATRFPIVIVGGAALLGWIAGDGIYEATITVGVPVFVRAPADKDMWMKPVTTNFHFKLAGSKVTEVTEPAEETQK